MVGVLNPNVHLNGTGHASTSAIRIGGCSGSVTDRRDALARLAKSDQVDAIIGDWMSEYNMTTRGGDKHAGYNDAWEPTFIEALEPALESLTVNKKRFVCNAGASDTEKLTLKVAQIIKEKGLDLKVAWVEGDEVYDQVRDQVSRDGGATFKSLTTDKTLADWGFEPIYAQAYLG